MRTCARVRMRTDGVFRRLGDGQLKLIAKIVALNFEYRSATKMGHVTGGLISHLTGALSTHLSARPMLPPPFLALLVPPAVLKWAIESRNKQAAAQATGLATSSRNSTCCCHDECELSQSRQDLGQRQPKKTELRADQGLISASTGCFGADTELPDLPCHTQWPACC